VAGVPPTTRSRSRRGAATIAAIRTIFSTGTRAATSGAVNPPSEWATRTISERSPIASTTVSV
jgi:hypothetical protein